MSIITYYDRPLYELEAKANIARYLLDCHLVRLAACTQQSVANDLVSCVVAGTVRLYFGYESSAFKCKG